MREVVLWAPDRVHRQYLLEEERARTEHRADTPNIVVVHHRIRIHFIEAPGADFPRCLGEVMECRASLMPK